MNKRKKKTYGANYIINQAPRPKYLTQEEIMVLIFKWFIGALAVIIIIGAMTYKHLHKPHYKHPLHNRISLHYKY